MAQPPTGCTIELPNESDIHFWEVTMQGPPQSVYAVSLSGPHQQYSPLTNLLGRSLQNPRFPSQRLPIQAADHQL